MRYDVRAEDVPVVLEAVRAFVDEVARKEGGTARYQAFQHEDAPGRFTHLMEFRTPSAEEYHRKTAWYKRFEEALRPRCTQGPEVGTLRLVEKG